MLDLRVVQGTPDKTDADTLILFLPEDSHEFTGSANQVNIALDGHLNELVDRGEFAGKLGQAIVVYPRGKLKAHRVVLAGIGKREDLKLDHLRRALSSGIKKAREHKVENATIALDGVTANGISVYDAVYGLTEAAIMTLYVYRGQKRANNDMDTLTRLEILTSSDDFEEAKSGLLVGQAYGNGACLARDLVNLPPNICTPDYLAKEAEEIAVEVGLRFESLGKKQITALKMGAFLGVAQGSETPPRFIVLEHNADHAKKLDTLVLVGKGVTFDTGGYTLKTHDGMVNMKFDMGGAAAVIAAMHIIGKLGIPLNVIGLVPAVDNMISGNAYRPGDVLTASNGKTIEVISTDAEGRLLLADALVYAKRFDPSAVIDIATLTGACVTALGKQAAAVFGTQANLIDRLIWAGDATGERLWPLPLYPEYRKAIDSETADMKNTGGAGSGVGTSAIFLKEFADYPRWAHLDIAGMVRDIGDDGYIPASGASGFGARLLARFVQDWAGT